MSSQLVCSCCGDYNSTVLKDLLKHIRLQHADSPRFNIQCGLNGCSRTFKNFHTFRNHGYSHHHSVEKPTEQSQQGREQHTDHSHNLLDSSVSESEDTGHISVRYQQLHCYQQCSGASLNEEEFQIGPGEMILCEEFPSLQMDSHQHVYRYSPIKYMYT